MPRTARASAANLCYHVLNRGNNRAAVFHKDADFRAFLDLLTEASLRHPMRLLAYCLLPNHFHLALWPLGDGDLSRWMHWLLTAHVRRYQRRVRRDGPFGPHPGCWGRRLRWAWNPRSGGEGTPGWPQVGAKMPEAAIPPILPIPLSQFTMSPCALFVASPFHARPRSTTPHCGAPIAQPG